MASITQTQSQPQHDSIAPTRPAAVDFDVYLALCVAALLAFGLLMVYSTTFDWSYVDYNSPIRIFLNQLRSAAIGVVAMVVVWRMDYRVLRDRRVASAIMLVTILALSALLVLNTQTLGARRALVNGSYQPAEAAKLALIIYFGAWLASRREQLQQLGYGLIPFSILVGAVGGLIVMQPDLSTAAILTLTAWTMFFLAGANIVQILLAGAGVVTVGVLMITQFAYAQQRLIDHVKAMQDLTTASWHVQQAIIAFTAPGDRPGGSFSPNWFGIGLGESRQKFGFLPFPHTDSIFAIIGEELGLFGCLVLIGLYAFFVWRAFQISRNAQDSFGGLLAAGIGAWIAYEAMLNIAVVTAIVPFTGVALPFISYGGSNLVVVLTACGLLLSISRRRLRRNDISTAPPEPKFDFGPAVTSSQVRRRRVTRIGARVNDEE